jgi:hypothetical protein
MRHLPRDRRGLPVPVIVMHDRDGNPLFAANDEVERQRLIREDRCQICGDKLLRGRWYVGGHVSVCALHGLNLDSPMHDECMHYAVRVCPYLAAPRYGRLVGQKLAKDAGIMTIKTGTEENSRPELFVAVMAIGRPEQRQGGHLPGFPGAVVYGVRPRLGSIRKLELWRHGVEIQPTIDQRMEIEAACAVAGDAMRKDVRRLLP